VWSRRRNAPIGFVGPVGGRDRARFELNIKSDFAARFAVLSELLLTRQK
jgi:hypothetical protein